MTETVINETLGFEPQRPEIRWDGRHHSYRPAPDWLSRVSPKLVLDRDVDAELDPVTFEVIRNRLWTSNLAHGETLTRISGSPVFQALDFNMCFLTEEAEVVMNAPFIVYLDVGATLAVRYIMENFSEDPGIHEGDIFLASDPWIGASHQMDVLIAAPAFVDGKLFAWVSNAGHQYDMGGIVPGGWPQNAPDIYHDPVFFSPFKIVERGVMRKDLEQMYRRQSRLPDLLALDLRAQLSGCRFAAEEVQKLCAQFGAPTIKASMRRIIENAQASFSEKLERIPDGRWSEVRFLDEKMPGDRHTYRMQVNIEKRGDRLLVDNHGTDPQQEGPVGFVYNNFIGGLLGMLSVTMLCEHLFALGGAERQIDLDPEPGLLSCVDYPAAVSGGVCSIVNYMNAVLMILSRMLACDPELKRDSLGAQNEVPLLVLTGLNDRDEYVGTGLFDFCAQGSAGQSGRDGVDTTGFSWSPLMRLLNAEDVEQVFPIMYLYRREQPDGGGAGKWRGGTGMEFAFTPYRAKTISAITNVGGSAISTHGALGLCGGYPVGTSNFLVLKETDLLNRFAERDLPNDVRELRAGHQLRLRGKSNGTELLPGDVLESTFGGGGGYGDPIQRDPTAVAHDIELGYVSRATAEEVYGVRFDAAGGVDARGTDARRSAILAERLRWPRADALFTNPNGDAYTAATGQPDRAVHEVVVARDVDGRRCLVCIECSTTLSDYRGNYKLGLLVNEGPVTLIPKVSDPTFFLDDPMVFRRYCCPGCGVLMTTELLREGDEPVEEVVFRVTFSIGVDIGGTFTDGIVVDERGGITIGKAPSTPPDFERGFIDALESVARRMGLALEELVRGSDGIYHGCTVGTNALVEGRTARVGLLTTHGMQDSIFVMQGGGRLWGQPAERIARPASHSKPTPLVPKHLVEQVDERITFDGTIVVRLNEDRARAAIQRLAEAGAEAFAISLMWSVVNPVHERRLAELVREMAPEAFVSVSSEVIARTGEYQRTVATVINAAIGPPMRSYLEHLDAELSALGYDRPLYVMSCTGGVLESRLARQLPLLTIGSGPVGGLIGAGALARAGNDAAAETADVITADMGGTTFDVGVIRNGTPLVRRTTRHDQYEYFVPTLDVRSIGAGGGSIVRFDPQSRTLRVGPESAGARPGPAAYRRGGTQATVTDADIVLGYLNPDYFLGGELSLSVDAAREALAAAGEPLGFGADETAAAAARIVDNQMADAIRLASVQQGYDPREHVLYAYGGAGPVHATALARELGMKKIVVPLSDLASGWSAFGVVSADAVAVEEMPQMLAYPFDPETLNDAWDQLEERALSVMASQGIARDALQLERSADLRYTAQVNDVRVACPLARFDAAVVDDVVASFEREYARLFGADSGYPDAGYLLTSLTVRARAPRMQVAIAHPANGENGSGIEPRTTRGVIYYEQGLQRRDTPVYDGPSFRSGMAIEGPAVIEYVDTTVVLRDGQRATVDGNGSIAVAV